MLATTVLAPRLSHVKDGVQPRNGRLYRGTVLTTDEEQVLVRLETNETVSVRSEELLQWKGYAAAVSSSGSDGGDDGMPASIGIWRCEMHSEGLFSAVFWALGFLEAELTGMNLFGAGPAPSHVLVDWTDPQLPYHGGRKYHPSNAWDAFFEPLPSMAVAEDIDEEADATHNVHSRKRPPTSAAAIEMAARSGRLVVTTLWGTYRKLANFRGAEPRTFSSNPSTGGPLDPETIAAGRLAFRRWLVVKPALAERARSAFDALCTEHQLPAAQWLAVHVRQTDRLRLASGEHWRFSVRSLTHQVQERCARRRCRGALIASDDSRLKAQLVDAVRETGLCAASYDALLSSEPGTAAHQDASIDRRRNAQDCVVETLMMAQCAALLSTLSNVSVAAVLFSREGYDCALFDTDAEPEGDEEELCMC